jgi:hypothetical protein
MKEVMADQMMVIEVVTEEVGGKGSSDNRSKSKSI